MSTSQADTDLYETDAAYVEAWERWVKKTVDDRNAALDKEILDHLKTLPPDYFDNLEIPYPPSIFATNAAINAWEDKVFSTTKRDDPLRHKGLPEIDL